MTDIPKKLFETARTVLTLASTRTDHLVRPPKLPAAAARQVIRSLLKGGLVEEVPAPIEDTAYAWRTNEDGAALMLRATALGLARIVEADGTQELPMTDEAAAIAAGSEAFASQRQDVDTSDATTVVTAVAEANRPPLATTAEAARMGEAAPTSVQPCDAAQAAPTAPTRGKVQDALRQTTQALLDAWDNLTNHESDNIGALDDLFAALRAALAARRAAPDESSRQPKDTKQAQVLAMLRREAGASGPAIAEAMGWAPHTVRGFLAGLSRKGVTVEVLERVRQVGPNKAGAKGSYTVYRIADASEQ
jgi:hypothetical protein